MGPRGEQSELKKKSAGLLDSSGLWLSLRTDPGSRTHESRGTTAQQHCKPPQ